MTKHWVVIDPSVASSAWSRVRCSLEEEGHICELLRLSDLASGNERGSMLDALADAAAVRLSTSPVNLAGHGLGADIAIKVAARNPGIVGRVFVRSPRALPPRAAKRIATGRVPRVVAQTATELSPAWLRAWGAKAGARRFGPWPAPESAIEPPEGTVRDAPAAAALLGQRMALVHEASTTPIPSLDCPVRLLAAAEEPVAVPSGWDWVRVPERRWADAHLPEGIAREMIRFSEMTSTWAELQEGLVSEHRLIAKAWAPTREEAVARAARVLSIGVRNETDPRRARQIGSGHPPRLRTWFTAGVGFGLLEFTSPWPEAPIGRRVPDRYWIVEHWERAGRPDQLAIPESSYWLQVGS